MGRIDWVKELGWNEDNLEDLRMAGYAYIRQGKYAIALPFFEALTVFDENSGYDLQTLGALYLELNRPKDSIAFLEKSLKFDSDHTPTLLNLTKALFMTGREDEALKLAELLSKDASPSIANIAKALILAYSP